MTVLSDKVQFKCISKVLFLKCIIYEFGITISNFFSGLRINGQSLYQYPYRMVSNKYSCHDAKGNNLKEKTDSSSL